VKLRYLKLIAVCVGIAMVFGASTQLVAQKKSSKSDIVRYDGRVTNVSKDKSLLTIQSKSGPLQITYTAKTTFTYRNKPGTVDDVKEGRRVIVLLDATQKDKLVAARIDVRDK